VAGYELYATVVNNRECGGEQNRERRFSFGTADGRPLLLDWPAPPVPMTWRPAVCAGGNGRETPVALCGGTHRGRPKKGGALAARDMGWKTKAAAAAAAAAAQGLPADFDLPAFTVAAKVKAIGNGVPLPLGRAIARAVARATRGTDAAQQTLEAVAK
jgi:DNA (cytosine-5)-methyltransferase 1